MNRRFVGCIAALSLGAVACGGNKRPANSEESAPPIILLEKDMGEKAYDMPAVFALLSRKHGCKVDYKAERAISVCNEGLIGLGRNGTVVRVACDGRMTRVQCQGLFDAIASEANDGAPPESGGR